MLGQQLIRKTLRALNSRNANGLLARNLSKILSRCCKTVMHASTCR